MTSEYIPVGFLRRAAAIVYDSILLTAILFIASLVVVVPLKITDNSPLYPAFVLYVYLVGFLFFGWCWTHGGQTLGMRSWKFKVASLDGSRVSWKQAALRYLFSIISWAMLGLGYAWMFTNKKRIALNDLCSKTQLQLVP